MKKIAVGMAVLAIGFGLPVWATTLPVEYQEVEYVEATGSQYLDTGFVPDAGAEIVAKYQLTALPTDEHKGYVFGEWGSAGRLQFAHQANGKGFFGFGEQAGYDNSTVDLANDLDIHVVAYTNGMFTVDGMFKKELKTWGGTPVSLWLFACNGNGSPSGSSMGCLRIYSCRIYSDKKLVHDLVPCCKEADGTVGFYDLVAEAFRPLSAVASVGSRIYVAKNGDDATESGCTPGGTPYLTVNAALAHAGHGDEIIVGPGTYDITSELVLDKAIVLRSESGNPGDTTLDAKGKGRVVTVNHPLAVLSGFTLMRGNVGYQYGGNALIWENGGTITNCHLVKHGDGKPIACGYGGGVAAVTGLVTHCIIADNQISTQRGAGAWLAGYAVMRNCIISNNYHHTEYTQFGGGGLYIEGYKFSGTSTAIGNVIVENCTIVGNRQRNGGNINGAGIAVSGSSPVIRNCIIRDNKRNDTGAISDCSNLSVLRKCCISQELAVSPDANGNFNDDPLFAADDPFFGLDSTKSPCYNTGLLFDWMIGATDFGGTVKRIENGTPDIGARELYTGNLLLCEFAPDVTYGSAPLNVTYTAVVSGAEVAETMFRWDLDGDGAFDREEKGLAKVSYTYQSGAPDVTLVVEADTRAATNVVPTAVAVKSMEVFVSLDNPNARKPFDTWATAAATIRDALPYLENKGVMTVDEGTYPQVYAFSLADGKRLRGRYGAERTVISGGGSVGKVISLSGGAVLEGVTVSDGGSGGNVSLNGATVTNCILRNTTGGGNNTGGGITSMGASYVYNTVITNCVSGSWGYGANNSAGGIFVNAGTLTAYNSLIANCRTTNGNHPGGTCGNAVLVNCTVADCQNTKSGGTMPGGMNAGQCKNSIIANCKCGSADSPYSGTTFNHACVYPASAAISGAITNNPCFKGGSNPYALSFASPCRNAGDNSLVKGTVDLAGKPRKVDRVVDIGCYEADPAGLSVIVR